MRFFSFCILLCLWQTVSFKTLAQKPVKVHGKATLVVSEDDNLTPIEAKRECIARARYEAIKEAFGEKVITNTEILDFIGEDGHDLNSFVQETSMSARAEWIEDTKKPVVKFESREGGIVGIFTAEVWGMARAIPVSQIDFSWNVLCGGKDGRYESLKFLNRQRIFIKFKTPVSGYLAIYLLDSTKKEASCLLPYKNNQMGQHKVQAGREYVFFDSEVDPMAKNYRLTTDEPIEMDQVVLIFSPNPFTKCNEITGDRRHPNSLSIEDFEVWLKKQRLRDTDIVVDRNKWIKIINNNI